MKQHSASPRRPFKRQVKGEAEVSGVDTPHTALLSLLCRCWSKLWMCCAKCTECHAGWLCIDSLRKTYPHPNPPVVLLLRVVGCVYTMQALYFLDSCVRCARSEGCVVELQADNAGDLCSPRGGTGGALPWRQWHRHCHTWVQSLAGCACLTPSPQH